MERVNLSHLMEHGPDEELHLVRLDESDTALIPFTMETVRVSLHWCDEVEMRGFVACNGADCLLCAIGRKKEDRCLIPVYLPSLQVIGVLSVSTSKRPNALLPQIYPVLRSSKPVVAFVSRHINKFKVSTRDLPEDADGGEALIPKFLEEFAAGRIDLSTVFQRIPNEQLKDVSEIARMLDLKGIKT